MIYITKTSDLDPADSSWQPLLSAVRKQKLEMLKTKEDQQRSLAVELLLCYALRREYPMLKLPPEYHIDANGKPVWKDDTLYFSLSHSGQYAACAMGNAPVGIDIQQQNVKNTKALERVMTPNQLAMIRAMPPKKQKTALFDFWCLKESIVKMTGQGHLMTPVEFLFYNDNGRLGMMVEQNFLHTYSAIPGYSLGLCSQTKISSHIWNLSVQQLQTLLQEENE